MDPGHLSLVVVIVLFALLFDFLNGMNDAANAIATVVSTRVLPPQLAVGWASFFNFLAVFIFGVHVATTIGKGIVDPAQVSEPMVLAALIGATVWTYLCTEFGLPISVSHALIGGLVGAALVKAGPQSLIVEGIAWVTLFIVLSPVIGAFLGVFLMWAVFWLFRKWPVSRVDNVFRVGQLLSSATFSLGHGTNDAQKTMGIISLVLFKAGLLGESFYVPVWVIVSAGAAIGLGTLVGGWRVVRTMGMRLTKLKPVGGFCAETAGAAALIGTAMAGIPVSTTHTIAGAIVGVGSTVRLSAVRWGVAGQIVWAWVLTIPASALVGAGAWEIMELLGLV